MHKNIIVIVKLFTHIREYCVLRLDVKQFKMYKSFKNRWLTIFFTLI